MKFARPLPAYLVQRYHGWKATTYAENKGWYRRLADEGQRPRAMVISCCDSRVHVTAIFGADQGEFFIHRNIANLVPAYHPDGAHILRPGFDRLPAGDDAARKQALEKEAILVSLENLMSFPFVKDAVDEETLSLHGVWNEIGKGEIETFDPNSQNFVAI